MRATVQDVDSSLMKGTYLETGKRGQETQLRKKCLIINH